MKCNQCGREVNIFEWKYCPDCGSGFYDERVINFLVSFVKKKRNIYILIIIILGLTFGFSWKISKNNEEIRKKNAALLNYEIKETDVGIEWSPKEKIMPLINGSKNIVGSLKVKSLQFSKLKIETEIEGIAEKKVDLITIQPGTVDLAVDTDISKLGYEKLKDSQTGKLSVKITQIKANGENVVFSGESNLFFNSIYEIAWNQNGVYNYKYALRLVDKDALKIVELVHDAAKYVAEFGGYKNTMLGSLSTTDKEVLAQVKAIFKILKEDYQIRYITSPFSYNGNNVQKIKDPIQVIQTKSGICIDLSLLWVAAFENLGFDPVLVFTDSHVWPGIEIGYNSGKFIFIESTALNETPDEAVKIAEKNWNEINKKGTAVGHTLIRVTGARSEGILPIVKY